MNAIMLMNHYEAPLIVLIELCPEGVICGSNELLEENEGEW